ncbi:MAG: hypothetical protein ACRD3E_10590 [Terriglobales bacterium]
MVFWVLCIHYYAPFLLTLALLAAMLTVAGMALMPVEEIVERGKS